MFYYIILFYFNPPKSVGGMEGKGRNKFSETLNSPEGARGMEGDRFVLLYYFVLFQISKICWRNGGRGTEKI